MRGTPALLLALAFAAPAVGQEPGPDAADAPGGAPPAPAGASARSAAGPAIERLDLTRTPVVEARIVVRDTAGAYVHGLRAEEFEVRLDGRPVPLGDRATIASRLADGERITVLAVVDVSGSMRAALPHVRAAIADFAARLAEDDAIGLVTVADRPGIPIPPGADRDRLIAILDSVPIGGNTAILDAVVAGLDSLAARPSPRQALIVLSDGVDNRSRASVAEASAAARERGIPIYGIALGGAADTTRMAALARASGGRLVHEADPAGLRRIYADLAGLLEGEYRLTLHLDDAEVGGWHDLEVALRTPLPGAREADARPFLASRTPGVERARLGAGGARAGRDRTATLWAGGALFLLAAALGVAIAARRSERSRALVAALAVALAAAVAAAAGLAWWWLAT